MARMILFFLLMLLMTYGCNGAAREDHPNLDQEVLKTNGPLRYFVMKNPGKEVIKYAYKDLNNDGQEDLLIIYKVGKERNMMCAILNSGANYFATNEVPAPVSNQVVHFKDIDGKPPMEFIVHGMKGAKVGYAIFRIENSQIVDLFGEGMADCC